MEEQQANDWLQNSIRQNAFDSLKEDMEQEDKNVFHKFFEFVKKGI